MKNYANGGESYPPVSSILAVFLLANFLALDFPVNSVSLPATFDNPGKPINSSCLAIKS